MSVMRQFYHLLVTALLLTAVPCGAASIVDSKHNLSVSGPGTVKSTTETAICVFCHTPHIARRDVAYLWNRDDSTVNYTTYSSPTMQATIGQPTGASRMCLSCHDGSIALGNLLTRTTDIPFAGGVTVMPAGPANLGSSLTGEHPVSFVYDNALAIADGGLADPATLPAAIKMDKNNELQCTTCHDPHDNTYGKFLVLDNSTSSLCIACHEPSAQAGPTHLTSPVMLAATPPQSGTQSTASSGSKTGAAPATVGEQSCANCHVPHAAKGRTRLLKLADEEANCFVCHKGNVAAKNIERQTTKFYSHPVHLFAGVHDAAEDFTSTVQTHVECEDCHNPHANTGSTTTSTASAPNVPSSMLEVRGINATGNPVEESAYLYEVCFKCHADNNMVTFAEITRQVPQLNTRLEFDTSNPSYHPVEAVGRNPDVPSLLTTGYNEYSLIYCTDCHASDDGPGAGGSQARGPHGSSNRHILERNYTTTDNTQEDPIEYAMCYKCHDRDSIRADESFAEHKKHVFGEDAPCSACHDPHGSEQNTHLINFDVSIVKPNKNGLLEFQDLGRFRGSCSLSCHGEDHDFKDYKP